MKRVLTGRDTASRDSLRRVVDHLGEVIPFKRTEHAVLEHVPKDVHLTVTASPAEGQDVTVDLALAGHGYTVAPHLPARQVGERAPWRQQPLEDLA